MPTSKREEMIRQIEGKQSRKRELIKLMRPDPLTYFTGDNYGSTRKALYPSYSNEYSALDSDIYRMKELVLLLPKENTPEAQQNREKIVSAIEGKVDLLQNLYKQRSSGIMPTHQQMITNQIDDIQTEIEDKKLILSLL